MYEKIDGGIKKTLNSYELIIPTHDNENEEFSEELINQILDKIMSFFGGMTIINCLGYWKEGKQVYKDKNMKVIIDSDINKIKELVDFKKELEVLLKQEKIYLTQTGHKEEILSLQEFLKELGIEINDLKNLNEDSEFINRIVKNQESLFYRIGYKTINLSRDKNKIFWEREIAGIRFISEFDDNYPSNTLILSNDTLETAFTPKNLGKPIVLIGDYESQKYALDKSKLMFLIKIPFEDYPKLDGAFFHPWYGYLDTKKFTLFFTGQVLINYIILRDLGVKPNEINISVGSDGAMITARKHLLLNPAKINDDKLQKFIIKCIEIGREKFEKNDIDPLALKQAKVLNRYSEKIAMLKAQTFRHRL